VREWNELIRPIVVTQDSSVSDDPAVADQGCAFHRIETSRRGWDVVHVDGSDRAAPQTRRFFSAGVPTAGGGAPSSRILPRIAAWKWNLWLNRTNDENLWRRQIGAQMTKLLPTLG